MDILRRKITDDLIRWKNESNGRSALLIEGARRVGKTYIAKEFGEKYYKSYILVDFSDEDNRALELFNNFHHDLDYLFSELSFLYKTTLYKRESLIILDEIQLAPKARQLVKHLVEDGRFDYIETGSLLSIKKNVKNILIPSEEDTICLYPMDFEEFCWANGDEQTIPFIKEHFDTLTPLGERNHKEVMKRFKEYLMVGGMPEAVKTYVNTKDFQHVDIEKRRILDLYRKDAAKYASGYEYKVLGIYDQIPGQLSKKQKRFKLSSLETNARTRDYTRAFSWLNEAMITNPCYRCTDPNAGLKLNSDSASVKLYMMDTGLLLTHAFHSDKVFDNQLYQAIMNDKLHVNEGMIMENIVAQQLRTSKNELYFYYGSDKDNPSKNYELDFLILDKNLKICPVDVKSSNYKSHHSLDMFIKKYKKRIGTPYILYTKDLMVKDGIVHLPLYMSMFL